MRRIAKTITLTSTFMLASALLGNKTLAQELTPENQLISLRHIMEQTDDADTRRATLRLIGKTGTFQALMYAGSYIKDKALAKQAAEAVAEIAVAHPEYNGDNTRELVREALPLLDKKARAAASKWLDAAPREEKGFVSIFNGTDLDGWKGLVENPIARSRMSEEQMKEAQAKADVQMRKDWVVEDGLLTYVGHGFDNLCTVEQYADFEMTVDWRLDPDGAEPDAGVYLRGTPQVQIWDIRRTNVGAQVGSGGLYNNQSNESKPSCVADNRLGEWNTFFIRMKGDRVTVVLNGVTVVNNVVMENYWDRKQPIFPKEQIEMQAHGSKVQFRDIYVRRI